MKFLANIVSYAYESISMHVLFVAFALAPVLGWLQNFVLSDWEFVVTALLGVSFSVIIALYAAIRTKGKVWPILETGLAKSFVYAFLLILTHRMARHHTSEAVDMITQHFDWLLYATIMAIELRQIKNNARKIGIPIPSILFDKLNDFISKFGNGQKQ